MSTGYKNVGLARVRLVPESPSRGRYDFPPIVERPFEFATKMRIR